MALDYQGKKGVATAIGHAPVSALVDPIAGSQLSIAEALTNIIWAPLSHGLKGVSLSANWMWPAKNEGENYRLYQAVKAISDFACDLGINIPTGKDSLSMTQKYPNGDVVYSPGTVIISAVAEVNDINKTISPSLINSENSSIIYIDFSKDEFHLGGSSFAQILNKVGTVSPSIKDTSYFANAFTTVQGLINNNLILSGHDVSAGGMITTLLEMCFPTNTIGIDLDITSLHDDLVALLFSEKSGIIIQTENTEEVEKVLTEAGLLYNSIGAINQTRTLSITHHSTNIDFDIDKQRDYWYRTSYLLDSKQCNNNLAKERYDNYASQALSFHFPDTFTGSFQQYNINPKRKEKSDIKAAIIREKGVNGDREMAYAMHLAGFDVKDIHMTDLIAGREDLSDINFIVFVGGFSNSDVLGSAKGWAGAFLYNEKAKNALDKFYARKDTLSLGVCNGCQLMMELGLLYPELGEKHPKLHHNTSGKFESAFLTLDIPENNTVMLNSLSGAKLGTWVAHGEGKFILPNKESDYNITSKYSHSSYPANPNGSDYNVAALASKDGRHLAMMPHLERSIFPWNWAHYKADRNKDEVSPWIEAFSNALDWVRTTKKHS